MRKLFVIFQDHQAGVWDHWITKFYFFFTSLLCRGDCVWERSCVLSVLIVIPQWRSFCARSFVNIVKILLCKGGDIEQWLEPRNISLCLCLIYFLSTPIALYILHCFTCLYSYARYSLCAHTCVEPRELLIVPSFSLEESQGVVPQPFTRIRAHSWLHIVC